MSNFIEYCRSPRETHEKLIDYLVSFLSPRGFVIKTKGIALFTYTHEEYCGGPARDYDSSIFYEDYGDYDQSIDVYEIIDISFVQPPLLVDVSFDYTLWNEQLDACVNTKQIPTSQHRTGKRYWNEYVGKFTQSWYHRDTFEMDFDTWFVENACKLQGLSEGINEQ